MAKNKRNRKGSAEEQRVTSEYYRLNTKAVKDLAEANVENSPEVSQEELDKYRSGPKIKIADWVKAILIKGWFAGAVCFFVFWGLSNETTTDDKAFGKEKIEGYYDLIKNLDSERLVGYVMAHGTDNPSAYYNHPKVDWFGCNIYVGWYIDQNSNNPSSRLNTRLKNILTNRKKPLAYSEYGCGGTQHCHSTNCLATTTRGNNPRHDIEYQMWLHEGHIAEIRNHPELLFTSQWQLFDIAVSSRNEGYTVCLDGEHATTDDELRRLNNKGLVERDHVTKKDTFYLYKAEWNSEDKFVHICGKDYTKKTERVIKCYTNDGDTLSMYVGNTLVETVNVDNHIAEFTATDFTPGVEIRVAGATASDTVTFQ